MRRYRMYLIPPLVILGLTGLALLGINWAVFAPQEASRVATATAQAQQLEYQAQGAATAIAAMATADAEQAAANLAATATAQAATATAEVGQGAASLAGTATAQAAANRATVTAQAAANLATAQANRCNNITLYTLQVAEKPQLQPEPGYVYITDRAWPAVYAAWEITNTGPCVWESVQLKNLERQEMAIALFRNGEEISSVAPGESATVALYFPRLAAPSQGEWYLVVNTLTLFDAPHLRFDLGDQVWIYVVDPTPTPTLTPTPIPRPTSKPKVCRTVCDKCEKCEQDEFGNTKCRQVDCNCREECD